MFEPDSKGFIDCLKAPTQVGGHAYLGVGINTRLRCPDGTKGAIRILNSWGSGWGQDGRAWIPLSQFDMLLKEDGEAACAKEILK
jgi:C1A family cysteine protease